MNNMRNKILSLLVLLMTAASGAWATSDISRALLSVPNSWEKDQAVFLTAEELPGFKAVTEEEAANWVPTDEDIENGAFLIYGFDAEGNMLSYATILGAPAVKNEPGKMPHNNMYALSHGSMLQVRFYYTSDVTLVGDKTEATFTMPAFDATVDYELVRDMSVQMTTTVGDGADGYRIRLKKNEQGEGYVPAEMTPQEMASLITVTDNIEQQDLTNVTDYTVQIFAVDEQGQITGDAINFASLVPGSYVAVATAADGSTYDGSTDMSNIFELYQGYEVTVPAGEFVTYYKDENLYVDDADAQLYTVSQVGDDKVLLSRIDVANANMPILVKNKSTQTKTIMLIPTTSQADVITPAAEFIGTLEATTIAASTENENNYAMNGLDFVWVKDPIAVGPNKAWLSVATSNARTLKLVYDDATAISEKVIVNSEEFATATWYDLNGRKLDGVPTKKGVYILNGKKVVVK